MAHFFHRYPHNQSTEGPHAVNISYFDYKGSPCIRSETYQQNIKNRKKHQKYQITKILIY